MISYRDSNTGDLRVAHCSNTSCTSATKTTLDSDGDVGLTSITIGADGRGLISYDEYAERTRSLKVAHCDDAACTSATTSTLDSGGRLGRYTSITIGADGLGLISYYDSTNGDLKVANCQNTECTSATTSTIDADGDVGQYTSITIGLDGLGLISYYDATNQNLKVAHCENTFCSPYFRRR